VWFDPDVLKGGSIVVDPETQKPVSVEELTDAIIAWIEVFKFISDMERGVFHVSLTEYRNFTGLFLDVMQEYRSAKAEYSTQTG
jgi:hypothetical protein